MYSKKEILEQNKDEIIQCYKNGNSLQPLADKLNCYIGTIYNFLKINNIEKRKHQANHGIIKLLEKNKDLIIKYYNNGKVMSELSKKFNCTNGTIYTFIKSKGINKRKHVGTIDVHRKYYINNNFFENIDNEKRAYWAGFIAADGCIFIKENISKYVLTIALKQSDDQHLKKFLKDICSNYPISYNNNTKSCRISCTSRKICNDLIKLGITPRKTFTLQFPDIRKDLVRHFIRGFFDGDGSVFKIKKSNRLGCSFVGQMNFLLSLQRILKEIGIDRPIYRQSENLCSLEIIRQSYVNIFYQWLYNNANIYLDRKYNKFKEYF